MSILEETAIEALRSAMECSQVVIITNANFQWIKYSFTTFFRDLFSFIMDHQIPIISSHDLFASQYPANPTSWKYYAVHLMVQSFLSSDRPIRYLISIGDSIFEKFACESVSTKDQIPAHIIQFLPRPTIKDLIQQLALIRKYYQSIASTPFNSSSVLNTFSHELNEFSFDPSFRCEYHMALQEPRDRNHKDGKVEMILQGKISLIAEV